MSCLPFFQYILLVNSNVFVEYFLYKLVKGADLDLLHSLT